MGIISLGYLMLLLLLAIIVATPITYFFELRGVYAFLNGIFWGILFILVAYLMRRKDNGKK